ncbi:MAG: hypothetical protein HUJ31_09510, partial [Pseudomonadales bacterium]|nr:hypothetical protein [Pseudomonadales bacterium]
MNRPPLSRLESGELDFLDYYFARFIADLDKATVGPDLQNLIADLSHALNDQHSCLDLNRYENRDAIIAALSELDSVGDGSVPTPLVLEGSRLFLHRFYQYEIRVATELARRNQRT